MSDKRVQVLDLLQEKTSAGKISWTQNTDTSFLAAVGRSAVRIDEIPGITDEPDYRLSLFNSNGDLAESFTDVQLYNELDKRYFSQMQTIYKLARRSALGTDKTFDDIISALKGEDDLL